MSRRPPFVLAILDGWGCRDETHGNAIAAADIPNWRRMLERNPWTEIDASGESVGLPPGIMGNSEVGHINIGSGRTVPQGIVVIDAQIADGSFKINPVLSSVLTHVRTTGGTLHFMGLLSDGKVHSSQDHLEAFIDAAVAASVPIAIDAFLDGRDVPPRSAKVYIERLENYLAAHGRAGAIASIGGRYYGMDRDKRWERVEKAYAALVRGTSEHHAPTAIAALEAAYARDENDEFVLPTIVGEPRPVRDGDAVIFFNFRPDRARELTMAFSDPKFSEFPVHHFANFVFATMTKYEEYFTNPVLFGPRPQNDTFGEIVSRAGLRQLRLAETEKYAHVTYFFNGGREDVFRVRTAILIPSNRCVATYDLAPEMSASRHHQHGSRRRRARPSRRDRDELRERRHGWPHRRVGRHDFGVETLDVCLGRLDQRRAQSRRHLSPSPPITATPKRSSMRKAIRSRHTRPTPCRSC